MIRLSTLAINLGRTFLYMALLAAFAIFSNCRTPRHTAKGEAIEHIVTIWKFKNNKDTPYLNIPTKAWYFDSLGLTQLCEIVTIDSGDNHSTKIQTMGYRFVDMKKNWIYEYSSLSDTAVIRKSYAYTNTTDVEGGWLFDYRSSLALDSIYSITDTTIDHVLYKHYVVRYAYNNVPCIGDCLFRTDQPQTFFQIDPNLGAKLGLPMVAIRTYPVANPHPTFSQKINFVSRTLPDSVVKIFNAWKENENKFPLK